MSTGLSQRYAPGWWGATTTADVRFHLQLSYSGVTVVVAAGNDNQDASEHSPARAMEAITVAASTFDDEKADFSNWGAPIDIWAPGLNITSTWKDGTTMTESGTSMATPHVAGFASCLLGIDPSLTPTQIVRMIRDRALNGVLGGVREYFCSGCVFDLRMLKSSPVAGGTVNRLLNNQSQTAFLVSHSGER